MPDNTSICVYVIDDDESIRNSLMMLLFSAGIKAMTYKSAEAFLNSDIREDNTCVVTDFKMPGLGGLDLQQQLIEKDIRIPMIFMTALDSEEDREQAFVSGAVGFLRKPVDDQALLDAIHWALSGSCTTRERV